MASPNWMNFWKISIQKIMLQILDLLIGLLSMKLEKKLQHDFPKMRGGGSKAVGNFSENSSVLVTCSAL